MKELEARLQGLVGMDRLRDAGAALIASMPAGQAGLRDEVVAWQAELARTERQHRTDELAPIDYAKARKRLAFKLLAIGHAVAESENPAPVAAAVAAPVFMSYNHADASAAGEVRATLEAAGIPVRMDVDAMPPGASIREFIRNAVRSTSATVCVVSERSLLSGWVGQETALALAVLDLWGERRFVACCLDMRFLDADFRLVATQLIDERLAGIEALLPRYAAERLDTNDLNAEKSRLFELRHQLGSILARLRGSLCLDIRPEARAASLVRLAQSLRGPA